MSRSGNACYRNGGCGPYEMYSCSECPASKSDYVQFKTKPKPKTNYDLLISKTPGELAEWLCRTQYREGDFCPPKHGWQYCQMADGCRACWLDWLKSPEEEGDNG